MSDGGDEIERLIDVVIDGRCDEASLSRFEELLRSDPRARQLYLEQMRVHSLLEWHHGRVEPRVDRHEPPRHSWRLSLRVRWGLAALVLIGVGLAVLSPRSDRRNRALGEVATLLEARNVDWGAGTPIPVKARVSAQTIQCESGLLRLAFDTGAIVTLEGPAHMRILSGKRLRAVQGRITARVDSDVKGFAIETPSTLVVDQGTEFGVEVEPDGKTGVVVFEGLVDLSRPKSADAPVEVKRLVQGEALSVDRAGLFSRIVAVERRPGESGWSTGPSTAPDAMIRSVHDNIRGLDSSKYYQIVYQGLDDDAPAYVDRPHEWNGRTSSGLPEFLRGADYIMPFNEDKWRNDLVITVEVAAAGSLFVFIDNRESVPAWLAQRFHDTGVDIGLDEGSWPDPSMFTVGRGPGRSINQVFSVWQKAVEPGELIDLGALMGGRNNRAMYGIAATAHR